VRRFRVPGVAAAMCVALGVSTVSLAQTANVDRAAGPAVAAGSLDPETRVLAREFAIRGAEAFEAGDYEAALENFNRATAILDVPSIAVMQARTLVKLGRWLEGLDRFQQTARLELDASAPLPYREAVGQATQEAEALRKQIPQVALLVASDATQAENPLAVTFDDKPVPLALLNISRPVNPGQHQVRVSSRGQVFFERLLDVAPSQQVQVHIPPAPKPEARTVSRPTPPSSPVAPAPIPEPESESSSRNWALYGAVGVTGLGLAGAVTTAILATNHKATLDDACKPRTDCPPEYDKDISALNTSRTLFFLSAGVTALAGGVATYFWLTAEDHSEQLALRVSPATVSLVGHY
jgi:hypothetical protein